MKDIILKKLNDYFQPTMIELKDQSAQHAGHNPAAKARGTHFALKIISAKFEGKSRIERHRMIYKILNTQLTQNIHALSITAISPEELRS